MKKLLIVILILIMSGSVYAKKKVHPIKIWDHQMHTDSFFTPSDIPCETCHIDYQYEWKGMRKEGCHDCHKDSKLLDYASKDCSRCHEKWPVKPADHKVNWAERHRTKAKIAKETCNSCHNDRFCIKCHNQSDSIQQNVHKRNFRYFHSIEARANPKKCDKCHALVYCTSCHTSSRGR